MRWLTCVVAVLATGRLALATGPESRELIGEFRAGSAEHKALAGSLRVIPFPNGWRLAVHFIKSQGEQSAIGATLWSGSALTPLRAGDWVRAAAGLHDSRLTIIPGFAGQIYGAALLEDGATLAVSIGWPGVTHKSENGIAVLRSGSGGSPSLQRVIPMQGIVRDLAAGPANTIVANYFNPLRFRETGRSPTLVVLDTEGNTRAELMMAAKETDEEGAAVDNVRHSRIKRLSARRYALLEPEQGRMRILELTARPAGKSADAQRKLSGERDALAGADRFECVTASAVQLPAVRMTAGASESVYPLGFDVADDGSVTVAVLRIVNKKGCTLVTRYSASGSVLAEWTLPAYRAAYWEGGALVGVSVTDKAIMESTEFK